MPQLIYDPPTAPIAGFCQTIRMTEGDQIVGTAIWHAATDTHDGVVQILDFSIVKPHCRQGYGKRLMAAVVTETLAYHRARKVAPRRLWVLLRQKRHIIARAFFASQGFTHIGTVKDLLTGEDGLIYIRTFD
jgi:GNAT superfamily N-acetyltransferase